LDRLAIPPLKCLRIPTILHNIAKFIFPERAQKPVEARAAGKRERRLQSNAFKG
jgi:hypothetical protein